MTTPRILCMTKRKHPSRFALERGRLIQRARIDAKMTPGELAAIAGKARTWVLALESGKIEKIHVPEGRFLISTLGMNPSQLSEEPGMYGDDLLPEASFQARRVARLWDELPQELKDYLWSHIEAYRTLVTKQPAVAAIMGTPVPGARERPTNKTT